MKSEQRVWRKEKGWQNLSDHGLSQSAQLVFIFGNLYFLKEFPLMDEIRKSYPNAQLIGCSTAGEIVGTQVFDHTVVITAVYFEHTHIKVVKDKLNQEDDNLTVAKRLADTLDKHDLKHVFVLSEGLNVNGSQLVKGFTSSLPDHVAVTGGLAGDQSYFKETFVVSNDQPQSNLVIAVAFYGDRLKIGYGSLGGWDSFGVDRLVTRSKDNVLYELDGKPALELYKKYLGDQAKDLPASGLLFPLSLRRNEDELDLVRTILSVNEAEGSMTFAGDIPEGSYVHLMKANFERLIDGAAGAANDSFQALGGDCPDLAILISCVGRKLVLKQRVEEEVESVQEILGDKTVLTGFYSYGELCPVTNSNNKCELHNQTMTITAFSER